MFDTSPASIPPPPGSLPGEPSCPPVQQSLLQLWSHAHYVPLIRCQALQGRQQLEEEATLGELLIFTAFSLRTGPSLCHVATETQIESRTLGSINQKTESGEILVAAK